MSNSALPQCSVVIRCYNEEQHIGRLLSGIAQQTVRDVEVIVVDSGAQENTQRVLPELHMLEKVRLS